MVERHLRARDITDARVLDAFARVPRHEFVPFAQTDHAYDDAPLPIGHGQTISQPYMVALMTQRLDVRPEDKVLEVGTGSGYHTAILAQLAGEVYSVERLKPLLDIAWERLMEMGVRNAHFKFADGTLGWAEQGPFDRILITAGAPELPKKLLMEQLKDGGVAVLPVGSADEQMLVVVRRNGDELEMNEVVPCRFVKLIGAEGWGEEKSA